MNQETRDARIESLTARVARLEGEQLTAAKRIATLTAQVRRGAHRSPLRRLGAKIGRVPASIRRRWRARELQRRIAAERPEVSAAEIQRRRDIIEEFLTTTGGPSSPVRTAPAPASSIPAPTPDPVVSIIIPVCGAIPDTMACLRSIERHRPTVSFEIIIANDCSDEREFAPVRRVPGLTILDTDVNLGFLLNCNRAAEVARGRYLWFLNSDTELTEGALDRLVDTFDDFGDAVIVGSKLVYPGGELQEAGGIVWNDGSAWNYGKGSDPTEPAVDYARIVDYVSGASLLVRRDFWDEVGGFDTAFAPAYYEDTDLCLQAADRGKAVVYQSASVVIHHEGSSNGTDVRDESNVKHHQVVNQEVFLRKWSGRLTDHRANGASPEREKERCVTKRALIVDARMLTPDQDSGSLRMTNLVRAYQRLGYKVTFAPQNLIAEEPYAERLRCAGVEVVAAPHVASVESFLRSRGREFDVVMLSRLEVAEVFVTTVRRSCPQARLVYDTVDLHFLRQHRELRLTGTIVGDSDLDRVQDMELACAERADATIVCSTAEQLLLSELLPMSRIEVLGNIHALELTGDRGPADRRDMIFVGGFEHPPNVDGVLWFVGEVLPLIVAVAPSTVFHVVGSKMPDEIWALDGANVAVHGFVEDLDPLYDRIRVSVAPLRYGAGVKGKVTQALAIGVPCVGTSMAVEGAGVVNEEHALIADDPREFAEACLRLLTDDGEWATIVTGGRRLIEERFSLGAAVDQLARVLAS